MNSKLEQYSCNKLSIVGLGGTGKTQLALYFAHLVKRSWPDYSIFWVAALSMESFEQAFIEIARTLQLSKATSTYGRENDTTSTAKEELRTYLNSVQSGRWLLIVDNADDPDILFGSENTKGIVDYLPINDQSVIMYTTRSLEVAWSLTRADILELGAMNTVEAAIFLRKLLIREPHRDENSIPELLQELTYLPLAIVQAAAYLNVNNVSVTDYLKSLRSTEQDFINLLSREFRDDTRYKESANAVASTWAISFSRLRNSDKMAADLLSFMSCIEWKAIPHSILPPVEPRSRMTNAIGTLAAYSFIQKRSDTQTYDLHRLVHLATRVWIQNHGNAVMTMNIAIAHVSRIFPTEEYRRHQWHENRTVWKAYLPHALCLLEHEKESDCKEELLDLKLKVGDSLIWNKRPRDALRWLEETFQARRTLDECDLRRLFIEHRLAIAYRDDRQIKKAVSLLEHVVATVKRMLGPYHPARLDAQQDLSITYRHDGQEQKAFRLLEDVVASEKNLSEDSPAYLASQHALAWMYIHREPIDKKALKKGIELLEHIVSMECRIMEENHPDRLTSLVVLAKGYSINGQTQKAISILERVVTIEEHLEEDKSDRLETQRVLANTYRLNGQIIEAVGLLEHVVAITSRVLPEESIDRLRSEDDIGLAYRSLGQVFKAIKLLNHVVAVREKVLEVDHPNLLRSRQHLASVLPPVPSGNPFRNTDDSLIRPE